MARVRRRRRFEFRSVDLVSTAVEPTTAAFIEAAITFLRIASTAMRRGVTPTMAHDTTATAPTLRESNRMGTMAAMVSFTTRRILIIMRPRSTVTETTGTTSRVTSTFIVAVISIIDSWRELPSADISRRLPSPGISDQTTQGVEFTLDALLCSCEFFEWVRSNRRRLKLCQRNTNMQSIWYEEKTCRMGKVNRVESIYKSSYETYWITKR